MEKEELEFLKEQNATHKELIGFLKEQNRTAIGLTEKQTETNTKMLEKLNKLDLLDEMNVSLKGVDKGFGNVLLRYDNFSKRMDEYSKQMMTIENNIRWGVIIILAIGVPIGFSLVKMAFF